MARKILDELVTILGFETEYAELEKFDRKVKAVRKNLDAWSKRFLIAGAVGTAALGVIGKAGLGTEGALNRTQAALSLTEAQIKSLHSEALSVGSELPLNTADIVKAQMAYGKLGATFGEILEDIPAIAGAAVATGAPVEQVATYGRIIQNVFGGNLQDNLDLMLKIANNSPASFEQLGASIQFSGQAAVDAGLDFKTYLATLAGTAGAGRSVESVSMGLLGGLGRLAAMQTEIGRGAGVLKDAFGKVGISLEDVRGMLDGTSEGFVDFLKFIHASKLESDELTGLLRTLFGEYSSSFQYAIQNPDAIENLLEEAGRSAGEIERQQEIILTGASGGVIKLRAMVDTLLNTLAFLGPLTAIEKITNKVSGLLTWMTRTDEEGELVNKTLLTGINVTLALVSGLLILGVALKGVSFALGGLVPLIKLVIFLKKWWGAQTLVLRAQLLGLAIQTKATTAAIWLKSTAMKAAAFATKLYTAAQWLLNAALYANPIVLIVVGVLALIGALVAAGYAVYRFRGAILGGLKKAWEWVKKNWPLLLAILGGPFTLAIALVWRFRDQIVGALQGLWEWINGLNLFNAGIAFIQSFIDGVQRMVGNLLDTVKGAFGRVRDFLPFSDAKVGPLSDLTESGRAILGTLSEGMRDGGPLPLADALLPVGPLPPRAAVGGGVGGGLTVNFTIERLEVNVPSGDPQEVQDAVTDALSAQNRALVEEIDSKIKA